MRVTYNKLIYNMRALEIYIYISCIKKLLWEKLELSNKVEISKYTENNI